MTAASRCVPPSLRCGHFRPFITSFFFRSTGPRRGLWATQGWPLAGRVRPVQRGVAGQSHVVAILNVSVIICWASKEEGLPGLQAAELGLDCSAMPACNKV